MYSRIASSHLQEACVGGNNVCNRLYAFFFGAIVLIVCSRTLMGLVKRFVQRTGAIHQSDKRDAISYPQLVGTRVCLGITEAGLFPGVVY